MDETAFGWSSSFDPSMLDKNVLISCPYEEEANNLMEILESHGIVWASGASLNQHSNRWEEYGKSTCYRIRGKKLWYASTDYYDRVGFLDHIRCTFCGVESPDFEAATEDEIRVFLSV